MRAFRFLNVAILSMLVGCSAVLVAQDKPQEDKPARQEEPKAQPKQDEAKPPHEEAKPPRPAEEKSARPDMREEKPKRMQEQKESHDQVKPPAREDHPEQRADARPARSGARIPDDKFRDHFGRGHSFRAQTVIVSGRPQFQYGGYSFELVDAWPAEWAYTDDCYIDYIDGEYFLIDLLHPGVRIAVFVVM